ncbi:hypothetical protein RhiirA1_451515 [Rhizophagus irregularis]|uniref:Uncharacterized protein n=1 Tax=Rhizophagus irregularis TaxID=588596 RepID=A0A2I1DZC5_9GLOM|nr:hypothetical protein RhiirA1_451515 [Rhizophagus irregularis]PKY15233.1 hypothetical protein RhiirB3_427398 [Rhizophagus irregularis]GET56366.1 hypothetical protein RIR_jg36998.t1 [Rhizophagus irregularis DAOM 181602=DAOM 197198]CAG8490012.1 7487_t:CDS:2 [Rhizophagus irregularis]
MIYSTLSNMMAIAYKEVYAKGAFDIDDGRTFESNGFNLSSLRDSTSKIVELDVYNDETKIDAKIEMELDTEIKIESKK